MRLRALHKEGASFVPDKIAIVVMVWSHLWQISYLNVKCKKDREADAVTTKNGDASCGGVAFEGGHPEQ